MNVTQQIAKTSIEPLKSMILNNLEIQIYSWPDGYAWRDSRFEDTKDEYEQRGLTYLQVKESLKKQLTRKL